jgi:hypothetical protein
MVASGVGFGQGRDLGTGRHMRRVIFGILDTPWGFRITCGVLFVIVMGLARYGLSALRSTDDTTMALEVGLPIIAAIFLLGWLLQRHSTSSH